MYLLPQRGWTKSTLLHTSLDSHVQIRPFCTRHAFFERSRGQIRPFCPVDESYSFGRNSSPCCAAAAPNSDDVHALYVLHVFVVSTGAKSTLLPTSLDLRVQIRPFCTRQAISELSRGQIVGFCPRHWIHVCRSGLFAPVVLH